MNENWIKKEDFDKLVKFELEKLQDELIGDFLYKIRHIPLFWVIDNDVLKEVYEAIDEIRDHYQKVVKE